MRLELLDLEPTFVRREVRRELGTFRRPDGTDETRQHDAVYIVDVPTIADAQGVQFLCPVCFVKNAGPIGTHQVLCWSRSRGVPDDASPGPGRWALVGSGLADLTLNADPPGTARSVDCGPGEWHGFVTAGEVT